MSRPNRTLVFRSSHNPSADVLSVAEYMYIQQAGYVKSLPGCGCRKKKEKKEKLLSKKKKKIISDTYSYQLRLHLIIMRSDRSILAECEHK